MAQKRINPFSPEELMNNAFKRPKRPALYKLLPPITTIGTRDEKMPLRDVGHDEDKDTTIESSTQETIARQWFLEFSTQVLAAFPREICDIVYEYLLPEDLQVYTIEYSVPFADRLCRSASPSPDFAYYMRTSFYDCPMTRDIVKLFYKKTQFKLHGVKLLQKFLDTEFPAEGCIPREHLRNLHIVLRPPNYTGDSRKPVSNGTSHIKEIVQTLDQQLQRIRRQQGFKLKITVYGRSCYIKELQEDTSEALGLFMGDMLPVIDRLRSRGFGLNILVLAVRNEVPLETAHYELNLQTLNELPVHRRIRQAKEFMCEGMGPWQLVRVEDGHPLL